jgi:transaldolase
MTTSTVGAGALENVNPRLRALSEAGVSVWLDQISRSLISGGELARLVAEQSLRGVTSNPAIFEKSILGAADYDAQISELARSGVDAEGIYDAIAVADVQGAADVLGAVHASSGGRDGFVSIEVPPKLARDTDATLIAARRYWNAVGRHNTMIKIPGTPEGVGAIEQAIYEGINVNVTLLFSVSAYMEIADAYIRGLERRHAEGLSLDVNSVASFFVSRVDTNVDRRLDQLGAPGELRGTAALANARAAYARFKQLTGERRWRALQAAGAAVQRPLWASTGVKNPSYADTLYVDNLIGPHTVNTMPLTTLAAVADHGEVPGVTAEQDYRADLEALAGAGIDMDAVTDELLVGGIRLFEEAMDALLAGIEQRRTEIVSSGAKG